MSSCDHPGAPPLTAAPDELAGQADTELSRHIRDCPQCSAAARKILAANAALGTVLAERSPTDALRLIAQARSAANTPEGKKDARWSWSLAMEAGWRWVPIAGGGILAAAVLLLAVVGSEEPLPGPEWDPHEVASEYAAQPLLVDAPGYNVAIIPTANPDITIFWFSKEYDDAQYVDAVRDRPIAIGPGNGL